MRRLPTMLSLRLLSLCFFALGCASLSVVGALQSISSALGLSRAHVALLVPAFAVTFAVGAPALQVLVGHWRRRTLLLTGLLLMAAGLLGCAAAPGYPLLIAARVLTGFGAALVSPMVSALGVALVPTERQGHALAIVFLGMTMASVVGVPLASWCAATLGWRAMFGLIALLALLAAILVAILIDDASHGQAVQVRHIVDVFAHRPTAGSLAVTVLGLASLFTTYTMITPILRDRFHAGAPSISLALFIYGLAGVAGNRVAQYLALHWSSMRSVKLALALLVTGFATLFLAPGWLAMALLALLPWAVAVDVLLPAQQRRIVELRPDMRGLVLALNSSALFVGIAVGGALAGGVSTRWGLDALPLASIGLSALAWVALTLTAPREARGTLVPTS